MFLIDPMIDCVSIATNQHFLEDPLAGQHKLRYREVIQKENWRNIYIVDGMEFDQYDNLATEYYVARNLQGKIIGVSRSYPTTIPYMLSEEFRYLFAGAPPSSPRIFEASRLVLDRGLLTKDQRRPVIDKIIVAYMERGLQRNLEAYVGFMLPKIWASTFQRAGWEIEWLGPEQYLPDTNEAVRAALMPVNKEMEARVRETTGIYGSVLNFGEKNTIQKPSLAVYSHDHNIITKAA